MPVKLVRKAKLETVTPQELLALKLSGDMYAAIFDPDHDYKIEGDQLDISAHLEETPSDGEVTKAPTSNWAHDHLDAADPHPGYVLESLYDADSVVTATSDNTPIVTTMAAQTVLGRVTGGHPDDIAIGIADDNILQVDDASAANDDYAKFTANGLEGVPYATVLSDIGAVATGDVDDVPVDGATTVPISSNWAFDQGTVTREPTGFPNVTDTSTPSFSSPTITLAKTGTSFDFYIQGVKYTKTVNQTVALPNGTATDTGTWYIAFNAAGTLTATKTTVWDIAAADSCPVAVLYFNGAAGRICDERHGTVMDAATHDMLHYTVGCRFESGLAGTFTDPTAIGIALGIIHDEDLEYAIGAKTQCVPFYHTSGVYTFGNAQNSYVVQVSDILQYDNLTNLTDVTNQKYVAYWVFATMDTLTPIWVLPGQRQDTLLKDARDLNKYESLSLGTLPFPEMKLLYRVLVQRNGTSEVYVETQDLRTVSNLPSGTYVATDHGALTGLLDDDHTQYLLVADIDDAPVDTATTVPISSNWAFDHAALTASVHNFDASGDAHPQAHASHHAVGATDTVFPADPNADKYLMWDDNPGALVWASAGAGTGDFMADGSVPMTGNLDFAYYKAITLTCDNGATVPASPVAGTWFLHTPTGRSVLMMYDGSNWIPILSLGTMTIYVDNTDGTDAIDTGGAVDAGAVKTVQYAVNLIPGLVGGNVTININAETYAEAVTIQGKNPTGAFTITLNGTLVVHDNLTMSGNGVQGTGATQSSVHVHSMTDHHYNNTLLKFTNSTNNGLYRIIDHNDTTDIIMAGQTLTAQPLATETCTVYTWGTILTSLTSQYLQSLVLINYISAAMTFSDVAGTVTACYGATLIVTNASISVNNSAFIGTGVISWINQNGYLIAVGTKWLSNAGSLVIRMETNGFFYIQGGNIIDTGAYCVYNNGCAMLCWVPDVNNFIRNGTTAGLYALTGAEIASTVSNTYSGCGTNESAVAASFSYID